MSIKITIPNSSSDVLTFGSGNTPTAAQIAGIDSGSSNGQLALYTTASGTSTERVRVDASGNVGIGTASPAQKLHLASAGGTYMQVQNTAASIISYFGTSTAGGVAQVSGAYPFSIFTNGSERLTVDSSGSLTLAGAGFMYFGNANQFIRSAGAVGSQMIVGASSGGFYQQVGATYYLVTTAGGSTSDETLKKNIQPIQNALSKVCAITGITYEFIEEPMCDADKGAQIGVGAQTVETQFPEIVVTQEDGKKTVRYDRLVAPLIEAIKEQQAIITSLTDRITALEGAK